MRFYKLSRARILAGNEPAWLKKHPRRKYIRASILSAGPWVTQAEIESFHALKRLLTDLTGEEHVVDHIIPLNHPFACGLTIACNLRVITRKQNAAKSNKWSPDQLELFTDNC